jgi:hypothetical protein
MFYFVEPDIAGSNSVDDGSFNCGVGGVPTFLIKVDASFDPRKFRPGSRNEVNNIPMGNIKMCNNSTIFVMSAAPESFI